MATMEHFTVINDRKEKESGYMLAYRDEEDVFSLVIGFDTEQEGKTFIRLAEGMVFDEIILLAKKFDLNSVVHGYNRSISEVR